MTATTISWTHDGQPLASIDLTYVRAAPVGVNVSMRIDGVEKGTAHVPSTFHDDVLGFVRSFDALPSTGIGVHVWERAATADVREIIVAMSNCVTDTHTHPGAADFSELRIAFAAGWSWWALERPPANGTQAFPVMGMLTRRFVLYRGTSRQAAHDLLYSQLGAPVRRFGPSAIELLPIAGNRGKFISSLVSTGSSGSGFYPDAVGLGVWFPFGDPKSYAHGGEGIFPSPELGDPLFHAIRADATAERERAIALNLDGSIVEAHQWPAFEYSCGRGAPHDQRPPCFSANGVNDPWTERRLNASTCPYAARIQTRVGEQGFSAHDPMHGCRRILDDLGLYYRTGDPLARMRIQLAAQDYMTSYRITQVGAEVESYPKEHLPFSMHFALKQASQSPHLGGRIQREMGWMYWTLAHAICITPPSPMRDRMIEHGRYYLDYAVTVAMPNGCSYMGQHKYNSDESEPWSLEAMRAKEWQGRILDDREQEMPVFQHGILTAGMYELGLAVGAFIQPIREIIEKSCTFLYGDSSRFVPDAYAKELHGPPWYAVTAKDLAPTKTLDGIGLAHTIHSWDALARAYRVSGDAKYLRMATTLTIAQEAGPPKSVLWAQNATSTDPWRAFCRNAVKP